MRHLGMVEWLKEYVIRRQERVEKLLYAFDVVLVRSMNFVLSVPLV